MTAMMKIKMVKVDDYYNVNGNDADYDYSMEATWLKEREGQITNLLILLNATAKEDSISVDYDDDDLSQGVTNSMKSKCKNTL